uniref:Gamma-glutamylcyclotransferase n=1 Tax=Gasterosteus aculeatus aculeatus TaxID=481459 RepID=A0AAQ4QV77_GASAC
MENHLTFLRFASGSNLLQERLRLRNPSAKVHCAARLKRAVARGVATVERSPGQEVWGLVWRMSTSDLESLDSGSQQPGHTCSRLTEPPASTRLFFAHVRAPNMRERQRAQRDIVALLSQLCLLQSQLC